MNNIKLKHKIIILSVGLLVSFIALIGFYIIPTVNKTIEDRTIDKMKNLVESAYSIMQTNYDSEKKGVITEEQAKNLAKEQIKALKYGADGYFWINDYKPTMIMHALKPEMDGQDMSDYKDPNGYKIFIAMVDVVKAKGEGTVKYEWPKPGKDAPQPKLSYVKGFEPWKWIVGSGIYVDDLEVMKASFRNKIIITTAVFSVVLAFLILAIIIPLNKSLNRIISYLVKVSSFDFSSKIDMIQKDELGNISKAVDEMVEELKN